MKLGQNTLFMHPTKMLYSFCKPQAPNPKKANHSGTLVARQHGNTPLLDRPIVSEKWSDLPRRIVFGEISLFAMLAVNDRFHWIS